MMGGDDWVEPVRTQSNDDERQSISDQVEAFLRKGGTIKRCGPEDNAEAKFNPCRDKTAMRKDLKEATYREMVRRREYKQQVAGK